MTLGTHASSSTRSTVVSAHRPARLLLVCGLIAGPFYIFVGLIQALLRSGYDPARQDLSLLSNGNLGWGPDHQFRYLRRTNRRVRCWTSSIAQEWAGQNEGSSPSRPVRTWTHHRGRIHRRPDGRIPTWDPSDKALHPTWHRTPHLVSGSIAFVGLIAACLVLALRFFRSGQRGWARWSATVGIFYLVAFVGIAGGSQESGSTLVGVTVGFTVAVVLGWIWIFTTATRSWKVSAEPSELRGN